MTGRSRIVGLTVVELLVLLAILAGLFALLLPGIQRSRAAAARMTCQNNLHQLALAMASYHEIVKKLPPPPVPNAAGGWPIAIMPFMEARGLADQLSQNSRLTGPSVDPLAERRPAIFSCPSAIERESAIPAIPVANYVIEQNRSRDYWRLGDAPNEFDAPWLANPEVPLHSWQELLGPHDGGFNIALNDGSVDFRLPTALEHQRSRQD